MKFVVAAFRWLSTSTRHANREHFTESSELEHSPSGRVSGCCHRQYPLGRANCSELHHWFPRKKIWMFAVLIALLQGTSPSPANAAQARSRRPSQREGVQKVRFAFCMSRGCGFQPQYHFLSAIFVCLILAASFPSHASAQLFSFGKKKDPLPIVFNRTPTQAELLQHITNNNSKFRQLSSDLRISLDGTPKLRGSMQLELPRRLRIKAGVMGVSQFGDLSRQSRRIQKRAVFRPPGDSTGARLVTRRPRANSVRRGRRS